MHREYTLMVTESKWTRFSVISEETDPQKVIDNFVESEAVYVDGETVDYHIEIEDK